MTALRYYSARRDANEPAIVRVFQDMGCLVWRLDKPVDLLIYCFKSLSERLLLVEVKTAKGDLNANQRAFVEAGWPVHVVRSEDDAISLVKRLRTDGASTEIARLRCALQVAERFVDDEHAATIVAAALWGEP